MHRALLWTTAALLAGGLAARSSADIASTKHNLSVSGPGLYRSDTEEQICKFCHTPHAANGQAPLWNRRDSGRQYVMYWSPTIDAYPAGGAPPVDGTSRLCLSCHDGTIALGDVVQGGPIQMRPGYERTTAGVGGGGGDLSGSHPISFPITEALIAQNNAKDSPLRPLAAIKADPDIKLDKNDKIQCTTCHDPHDNKYQASSGVPFYRKPTWEGGCLVCHQM